MATDWKWQMQWQTCLFLIGPVCFPCKFNLKIIHHTHAIWVIFVFVRQDGTDMELMWQAKLVQISIHHLWLINITRSTSSKLAFTICDSSTTSSNLHSPSVSQVQLAPTCTYHLWLKFNLLQPALTICDSSTTSSNLHSPSVTQVQLAETYTHHLWLKFN